jgi:3-oxoacyl-[acyl-carrier protein] reductase
MQADLKGRVALVTGSTRDIGKAIALKLAENGADVVVNGRDSERGLQVVEQIKAMGRRAIFERADLYSYAEVRQMANNAIAQLGKIDILVASGAAGAPGGAPRFFRDIEPDNYMVFATSRWFSRANCIRAVLDHMIERSYGKIIIITTDAGRVPTPAESMNGAAAAAVILMTRALANEFSRWKIRVNCLSITVTETETMKRTLASSQEPVAKVFRKAAERIPFGMDKPEDVAEAALFFASPDSDQITGAILSINGGLSFPG